MPDWFHGCHGTIFIYSITFKTIWLWLYSHYSIFFKEKNQGLHGHIKEILQNQREILSHLGVLTKELKGLRTDIDNKRDEVKEPVSVPNRIRVGICLLFC